MINNVPNISTTALQNASKTLEVSANNVANISNKGQVGGNLENGQPYTARRVDTVSRPEGGVSTTVRDTGLPVNLEQEVLNQKLASYQADASAKVLKVDDEITGSLLDILA